MPLPANTTIRSFYPFIKYSLVGVTGTIVDLAALYLLVEYAHLDVLFAATISFLFAVVNNFTWNKFWTFKDKSTNYRKQFIKFLIVSCVGLALTLSCMYVLVNMLFIWYMYAKVITSMIVLIWNFLGNKYWTFRLDKRFIKFLDGYNFEFSIVIPVYNEQNRINETLKKIDEYLNKKNITAEIIVVNDGSKDDTVNVIEEAKKQMKNMTLINLQKNYGKGYAVREGMLKAQGEYVLFTDADNSTPIEELKKLFIEIKKDKDIVIGSRYLAESNVEVKQSRFRIALSRTGNFLIRTFLINNIKDTQCGFKLFKHQVAQEIFSRQKTKRFAFDMEILTIAQSLGYEISEVPVRWINSTESKFRAVKDMVHTLLDLFYIKINLWSGRYR